MTQREIAETLNISIATVSRALKDSPLINEDTKRRVRKVAHASKYRPNFNAQSLLRGKTDTIGVIFPSNEVFFLELSTKVCEYIGFKDYLGFVFPYKTLGSYEKAVEMMMCRKVDGIISIGTSLKNILLLENENIPTVYYGAQEIPVNFVDVDKGKGIDLALECLIKKGHKDIGYVCKNDSKRFGAFKDVLLKHGLSLNPEWVVDSQGTLSNGYDSMKKILSLSRRPSAVIAHNDVAAIGAMKAVVEYGLKIPDDIAVMGFDNISMAEFSNPALTTVDQKIDEIAGKLVEIIVDNIETRPAGDFRSEIIEPDIIIRKSA